MQGACRIEGAAQRPQRAGGAAQWAGSAREARGERGRRREREGGGVACGVLPLVCGVGVWPIMCRYQAHAVQLSAAEKAASQVSPSRIMSNRPYATWPTMHGLPAQGSGVARSLLRCENPHGQRSRARLIARSSVIASPGKRHTMLLHHPCQDRHHANTGPEPGPTPKPPQPRNNLSWPSRHTSNHQPTMCPFGHIYT